MSLPVEMTCQEVAARLKGASDGMWLLDVRNPDERARVQIPSSRFIPLPELANRVGELQAEQKKPVVVYCHHGMRSLAGAEILRQAGFDASSLQGGIDAWARTIDVSLPRY